MKDGTAMWGSRRALLALMLGVLLSPWCVTADAQGAPGTQGAPGAPGAPLTPGGPVTRGEPVAPGGAGVAAPGAMQVPPEQTLLASAPQPELIVLGASSVTNALTEVSHAYTRRTLQNVKLSFAASSALARQIEAGAPADVFVSADEDWMDYLQTHHLLDNSTRRDILGNSLVLIAPLDSTIKLKIAPHFPLAAALGNGHLATGNPDSVPVGKYAKAALLRLRVWKQVEDKVVPADNVRAALAYVARGEAPLGIVYRTDALIEKKVKIIAVFPASSHDPITYPAAATVSAHDGAIRFVRFLQSRTAQAIFHKYGFDPAP